MLKATTKTLAQQQEQLKKIETFSALQETNKMLKMDRDKLEQELQQAQARVSLRLGLLFDIVLFSIGIVIIIGVAAKPFSLILLA